MPLQDRLPYFLDLLLDAVFLVDVHGRIVYVNAACELIFGYPPAEMIGRPLVDFVLPEDRARTLEEATKVASGQPRVGFENRYLRKDGRPVHIMWSASWSEADQLRVGVARDITEQKHAEAMQLAIYGVSEAAHDATDLATLFEQIHGIVARLLPVAGLAVATCGQEAARLDIRYCRDHLGRALALREDVASRHCAAAIRSGQPLTVCDDALAEPAGANEVWLVTPLLAQGQAKGAIFLKGPSGAVYSDRDRELLHFVSAQVATAMERWRLKEELLRAARHDELTGLPNRRLFQDRLDTALERSRRLGGRLALLYVDIDNFKTINDTYGHAVGDLLLQEFAHRLKDSVRASDTVARLGGDEFVLLLEEVQQLDHVEALAAKVHAATARPFRLGELVLEARASIGAACYPEHGTAAEALLKHADLAMYLDKKKRALHGMEVGQTG